LVALKLVRGTISPSKAHLHKTRGAQMQSGRQEAKQRVQKNVYLAQAPPKGCPGRTSALLSRYETHPDETSMKQLSS